MRDYLRKLDRERDWTELQGYVYGQRMAEAQPFPGVLEFFGRAVHHRLPIFIISHKTRHAVLGPRYDLQKTATEWLTSQISIRNGSAFRCRTFVGETRRKKSG